MYINKGHLGAVLFSLSMLSSSLNALTLTQNQKKLIAVGATIACLAPLGYACFATGKNPYKVLMKLKSLDTCYVHERIAILSPLAASIPTGIYAWKS